MQAPDIVVVGHVTRDLTGAGWRLGGTGAYATLVAAGLGLRVGLVTRCEAGLDLGPLAAAVEVHRIADRETTTCENRDVDGRREQHVRAVAGAIGAEDVPEAWRPAPVVLLGPVIGEVERSILGRFPDAVIGACGQGWLRQVGTGGQVEARQWDPGALLPEAYALFVSDEDVPWVGSREQLAAWAPGWPLLACTHGRGGAEVLHSGRWAQVAAYPVREVDPTGAGDSFAAAFLIRWTETREAEAAARFAAATSSFVVSAEGSAGIPSRAQVEARLRSDPGVLSR
jgi:hypothetical protein